MSQLARELSSDAIDYASEHPDEKRHPEDMKGVCSGCYLWGRCLIQRWSEANDSGRREQGYICPLYQTLAPDEAPVKKPSAMDLVDATCEECLLYDKCLFSRFPMASGWNDPRYVTEQDKNEMKKNPYGRYKVWEHTIGKTVCPLFMPKKASPQAPLLDANLTLKSIENWCKEQLKTGGTTKEDFDAHLVKFKAIKESSKAGLVTIPNSQLEAIQSLLIQVFGGIQNGNK